MFESVDSERSCKNPECLNTQFVSHQTVRQAGLWLIAFCLIGGYARAQAPQNSVEVYANAVKQSVIAERVAAMEQYLTLPGASSLKTDALEFLIWDHLRLQHRAQAVQHAKELLALEPVNPLAVAVLNDDSLPTGGGKNAGQRRLTMLTATLGSLQQLRRPEGMPAGNFQMLRRQVGMMLNGAIGLTYVDIGDQPAARPYLQQAVDDDPNNARWVYGLGLALLEGKNKDEYRGFWYLARAANLTSQIPQGREIGDYARRRYHDTGGKDADWQTFVASAAALDSPPSPAGSGQQKVSAATVARTTEPSQPSKPLDTNKPSPAAAASASTPPSSRTAESAKSASKRKEDSGFEATLREPDRGTVTPARKPNRPRPLAAPSEAVSLGILIETSLLTNQNRTAIVSTLKEIVRNLRANDEAAILVFSDQLDFEQDLTADDQLLEDALGQIHPRAGKALLSGISFAAGHLKRIGKNQNRILLVISDGASRPESTDTLAFRSQVAGVRIDCVGLKTEGETGRDLLTRISQYSGGKVSFASGPEEFRTAALEITRSMGIAMP